jgi:hypothetical protein
MTEYKKRAAAVARLRHGEAAVPSDPAPDTGRRSTPHKNIANVGLDFRDYLQCLPNDDAYHGAIIAALIDLSGPPQQY